MIYLGSSGRQSTRRAGVLALAMPRHLKICHTSDWHLGHTLHGCSRELEHEHFLAFLIDAMAEEQVDALIVAGDIFDSANPPAHAQTALYRFLAQARARLPRLDVLLIAGNHDSPARLVAPEPILLSQGVRVIGSVPRRGTGGRAEIDADAMVVPLHDRGGEVAAWVAAVPYLKSSDLPAIDGDDAVVQGVRAVYDAVLEAARARRKAGQALLATGHCHMIEARVSELSERRVLGGARHALPVDLFGDDVDYVALGHLHLPQAVGEREHVRYSGSPIPLSMPEESYPHQVRIVRFEGGRLVAQHPIRIPRTVDVLRVPRDRPAPLEMVLGLIERLELASDAPPERQPLLEVRVLLTAPVPDLRAQLEAAIAGRSVRLVKITVEHAGVGETLADSEPPRRELADLTPEEVFRRCYARKYADEPSLELLSAFHEVVEDARRAEADGP